MNTYCDDGQWRVIEHQETRDYTKFADIEWWFGPIPQPEEEL